MIAVVDYGAGNLRSVCNALDTLGETYSLASEPLELEGAGGILLPGVGHFGQMMGELRSRGLDDRIRAAAGNGIPLLGICLGMQALFDSSAEAPGVKGLGLMRGESERFGGGLRVPHMGWNEVRFLDVRAADFYFANSYFVPSGEFTEGVCDYGGEFSAVVRRGNVLGVQFHPEKSHQAGLDLLEAWCASC